MDTSKFPEVTRSVQMRALELTVEDILILRYIQRANRNDQGDKTTVSQLLQVFDIPRPTLYKRIDKMERLGLLYRYDCPGMCKYKGTGQREKHHDISTEGWKFVEALREAVN